MDETEFIRLRPDLYHLTDAKNIANIIKQKALLSTKRIVELSNIGDKNEFLRKRRPHHEKVYVGDCVYSIRDQRPISLLALSKCLTDNWTVSDFIEHLNKRVFFWCSLDRLRRHFNRYKYEKPCLIKCLTRDVLTLNKHNVEFCRLNSGATRPNAYLGGIAPYRGSQTFQIGRKYEHPPRTVVEVTVLDKCALPDACLIAGRPEGPWRQIDFS